MSRYGPSATPADTAPSSLTTLLTLTEAQLLTGQGITIDDWKRLLDAGADANMLHDLNQRSEHPILGSLGHLITHLPCGGWYRPPTWGTSRWVPMR